MESIYCTQSATYLQILRSDPYERAMLTSNTYYDWMLDRVYMLAGAKVIVGKFLSTFKEFPPRQKAASFNLSDVLDKMSETSSK